MITTLGFIVSIIIFYKLWGIVRQRIDDTACKGITAIFIILLIIVYSTAPAVSSSNLLLICVYSNDGNMQQPSETGSFPVRFCKASIKRDDAWAGGSRCGGSG